MFLYSPSPLPLYRVVAPFKIKLSAVRIPPQYSLKWILDGLSPIYLSYQISLDGFLDDILDRISSASTCLIASLVFNYQSGAPVTLTPQDDSVSTSVSAVVLQTASFLCQIFQI